MSEHDDCNIIGALSNKVLELEAENAALVAEVASLRIAQQAECATSKIEIQP